MFNTDFNQDDQQMFDLIPNNTIVPVVMTIRPGSAGEGGWFTESKTSDALMLDCEFTVSAGPFARRKFWQNMVLFGGKVDESGNSIAGKISRATLRAILESARGILPSDFSSEAAKKARTVSGPGDFNGMEFICKIGIQKGQNGYSDKNQISVVITPDKKEYAEVKAGNFEQTPSAPAATSSAPSWANNAPQTHTATPPPSNTQRPAIPAWAQ